MSCYNFFKKSHRLRIAAEFEPTEELEPPTGTPPPVPPSLVECRWNPELDGVTLIIEEPQLATWKSTYEKIEKLKAQLAEMMKEPNPDEARQRAIQSLASQLATYEAAVQDNDPSSYVYDERRVVLWSEIQHIVHSSGIITARIDLPFTDTIKNPDGSDKLGELGGRLIEIGFVDLPSSNRKLFPSGFARIADLSQAAIRFQAETIAASDIHTGAIASMESNLVDVQTPLKTHPAALDILARARQIKKEYRAKTKHANVIRQPIE